MSDSEQKEGVWYCDGRTVYTLVHGGFRKGKEVLVNRFRFLVDYNRDTDAEESAARTAGEIKDALNVHSETGLTPRELLAQRDELLEALEQLAEAEAAYRKAHDFDGDGSPEAGRAWDLMRRAGNAARAIMAEAKGKNE